MKRVGSRLAVLVLILATLIASMPARVTAPGALAANAGGGQGSGHMYAAPLDEAARAVAWLDPYLVPAIGSVP
jgi:hypothetical protein